MTLHSRIRDGKRVYRIWYGTVDRYGTGEISKEEALEILRAEHIATFERDVLYTFERADRHGSSGGSNPGTDAPWETEMCHCGAFHHTFDAPGSDVAAVTVTCRRCGEPRSYKAHAAPCARLQP